VVFFVDLKNTYIIGVFDTAQGITIAVILTKAAFAHGDTEGCVRMNSVLNTSFYNLVVQF